MCHETREQRSCGCAPQARSTALGMRVQADAAGSLPPATAVSQRPMGSANRGRFASGLHAGARAYALGWHPLWQVFRCLYQMTRQPYVTGGVALMLGYLQAFLAREPQIVPHEAVEFQRRDQMRRLRAAFGMGARS